MITLLTKEMITKEIEQDAHRLFSMLSRRYQRALSELFEDENTAPYVVGYIEDGRLHSPTNRTAICRRFRPPVVAIS